MISWVNSLRPSDAIWRQWSWTTLAQVMACCLTAPSHYLNQCWLITRGVLWHTSESSFAGIAQGIDSGYEFEKDILKNIFKSPRGQWVKKCEISIWKHNYIHHKRFGSHFCQTGSIYIENIYHIGWFRAEMLPWNILIIWCRWNQEFFILDLY